MIGYDCAECIRKEKIGTRGRICGEFAVPIIINSENYIVTHENLDIILDMLEQQYQTSHVEILLRRIGTGICPVAYPILPRNKSIIKILNWCMGGQNGLDLLHLPYGGGVYDQPASFLQAFDMIVQTKTEFLKDQMDKSQNESKPSGGEQSGMQSNRKR